MVTGFLDCSLESAGVALRGGNASEYDCYSIFGCYKCLSSMQVV